MLKSMTAYSHVTYECLLGHFIIEIHSVNRKHLEINTILPKELIRFDTDIKKWISAFVKRGQINVRIMASFNQDSPILVTPNLPLSQEIVAGWKKIIQTNHLHINDDTLLKLLSHEKGLLIYEDRPYDETTLYAVMEELVKQGIAKLLQLKMSEGEALYQDIHCRLMNLEQFIEKISLKSVDATTHHRQKLKEKLNDVLGDKIGSNLETNERLMREICLYAEKIDIVEELVRFRSHLQQIHLILCAADQKSVGKTIEFFIQELNREANTMGSKTPAIEVLHDVIQIKGELERIREQIQNVE